MLSKDYPLIVICGGATGWFGMDWVKYLGFHGAGSESKYFLDASKISC